MLGAYLVRHDGGWLKRAFDLGEWRGLITRPGVCDICSTPMAVKVSRASSPGRVLGTGSTEAHCISIYGLTT